MQDNVIITKPHEATATLAKLAGQIDVAHGNVETALRDGLRHARQAGALLLKAREIVPHGNWLAWLQANCKATPRTAQRYVKVAENWEEIVAQGGEHLGLHGAIKLLTRPRLKSPNTTRASYLPPALAYLHEEELLNDDALTQLLDLEKDYGPEVMTFLDFSHSGDIRPPRGRRRRDGRKCGGITGRGRRVDRHGPSSLTL